MVQRSVAAGAGARMIHVSALGADPDSPAAYARAKAAAKSKELMEAVQRFARTR